MADHTIIEDKNRKAHDLYYKLHKCLKRSLSGETENGDDLSCHTNAIVLHLAKSIESGETWFDESVDCWCNYFLAAGMNNYERYAGTPDRLSGFLASLPTLDGPWNDAFRKKYCGGCEIENCADCPNGNVEETNIKEWLKMRTERDEE